MRCIKRKTSGVLTKTGDSSNTLFSERYQQTYHSTFGARTESAHVFLHGAGVHERLSSNQKTRVLEIGFGLGLNCLVCADCAHGLQSSLEYTGIEHAPISEAQFSELDFGQWLDSPQLAQDLKPIFTDAQNLQKHQATTPVSRRLGEHISVELYVQDASATTLLTALKNEPGYDAILLDAFSPDVNPECWTTPFFGHLRALLAPHGRLATYCVKGSVRRSLEEAGFAVHKYPGPKGKREVLWANLPASQN